MTSLHLTCPVCQTEVDRDYLTHLNSQKKPALVQQLMTGELFRFECATCGAKRQLTYQFLYHDPAHAVMFFLLPEYRHESEALEAKLEEILLESSFSLAHYQLRVVVSVPELLEKIQIANAGYDDRVVEAVKLLTDGIFAQEKPDTPVKGRYFYLHDGAHKLLYLTNEGQIITDFHQKLVDFVATKYHKILAQSLAGEFQRIDYRWALELLEGHKAK